MLKRIFGKVMRFVIISRERQAQAYIDRYLNDRYLDRDRFMINYAGN